MKRVLSLFLVAAFLISIAGCTPKSEYEKLLDEKAAVEKKCVDLSSAKARLTEDVSRQQKEIKDLTSQLKAANANTKRLEKELAAAKAKIQSLSK